MINGAGFNPYYGQQQNAYMPQFQSGNNYGGPQFQGPPMPPPFMPGMMPGIQQGGFNGFQGFGQQQGPGFGGGPQGFFGGPNGARGQMRDQIDSVFSQFNLNAKEVFSQVKEALGGKRPSSPDEMQSTLTQVLQNDGLSSDDIQSLESQLPPPPPPHMGRHHHVNNQSDTSGTGSTNCKNTTDSTDSTDDSSTTTDTGTSSTDLSTLESELSTLLSALGGGTSSNGTTDASTLLSELSTLMASYSPSTTATS